MPAQDRSRPRGKRGYSTFRDNGGNPIPKDQVVRDCFDDLFKGVGLDKLEVWLRFLDHDLYGFIAAHLRDRYQSERDKHWGINFEDDTDVYRAMKIKAFVDGLLVVPEIFDRMKKEAQNRREAAARQQETNSSVFAEGRTG